MEPTTKAQWSDDALTSQFEQGFARGMERGRKDGIREGMRRAEQGYTGFADTAKIEKEAAGRKVKLNKCTNPDCDHAQWQHRDITVDETDPNSAGYGYRTTRVLAAREGSCARAGCDCPGFNMDTETRQKIAAAKALDDDLLSIIGEEEVPDTDWPGWPSGRAVKVAPPNTKLVTGKNYLVQGQAAEKSAAQLYSHCLNCGWLEPKRSIEYTCPHCGSFQAP